MTIMVSKNDLISITQYCMMNSEKITPKDVFKEYEGVIDAELIQEILDIMINRKSIRINEFDKRIIWLE